jgi:hypothetical protein
VRWLPSGLPSWVADLARAIDGRFQQRLPDAPTRLKAHVGVELTDAHAARNPHSVAINETTGQLVISVLVAGAWTWRKYDGSAL